MTRAIAMTRVNPCVITSVVAASLLSACVSMSGLGGESKYACAAPKGVTCRSVSGTYANAIRDGAIATRPPADAYGIPPEATQLASLDTARTGEHVTGQAAAPPRHSPDAEPRADALAAEPALHQRASLPVEALRDPPRILRLWTKAWEDADGDLWDQAFVYVQVSSGSWRIDHVRQSARQRAASVSPPQVSASASTKAGHSTGPGSTQSSIAEASSSGRPQFAPFPTIVPTLPLATRAAISPPADRASSGSSDRAVDRQSDNSQ